MSKLNHFMVGDIVSIKSNPLFFEYQIFQPKIHIPPLMLIKEVIVHDKNKRIFSDKIESAVISDRIRYKCVYFDAMNSEFVEKEIYHPLVDDFTNLKFHSDGEKNNDGNLTLIDEVLSYKESSYSYGKIVSVKTTKLEMRVKSKSDINFPKSLFVTPNLVLTGLKENEETNTYFEDGTTKRMVSKFLFKVMWFDHKQNKFREQYLPSNFLTDRIEYKMQH